MKKNRLLLISLLLLASCTKTETTTDVTENASGTGISEIMVPKSRMVLFTDLSAIIPQTKSSSLPEEYASLESLLNRDKEKTVEMDGFILSEIPFKEEIAEGYAFHGSYEDASFSSSTITRKFLISGDGQFIVTMVTDLRYAESHPDFDYLDKPNYSGAILFSELDGTLIEVDEYIEGQIVPAELLSKEAAENAEEEGYVHYIVLYEQAPETKTTISHWDGSPGLCVATYFDNKGVPDWEKDNYYNQIESDLNKGKHGNGGGSGSRTPTINKNEKKYTVSLSSNAPQEVNVLGSGTYTEGSKVAVAYEYKGYITQLTFSHWTGDLSSYKSASFLLTVKKDIQSTAYFNEAPPCKDNDSGIMNPLTEMSIAASSSWNYRGGTFGMTRIDKKTLEPKMHEGLDLYALPGTPIYASFSGEITRAVSSYDNSYVEKSFGNEIRISCGNFTIQYAHLQAGNPIAINPRTGNPFTTGDMVYQGDLIGYAGRTGNATEVPNPHLHLGILVAGRWVDPQAYINGTYDVNKLNTQKGKITVNKCD